MRNTFIGLWAIVLLCFSAGNMQAQEKQKVKMSLMKQSGQMVTLTITSPNEFYIGGNTHVLYIGNKHFDLHDQNNINGKGILKFYIPTDEFKKLTDGSKVYLSYGMLDADNEKELQDMCKQKFCPCWELGKLSKKQLK
jgi:hypothetical protein